MREQMRALTQNIAASVSERLMAVGDSRVETAGMLQAFGRDRAQMAKAMTSSLAAERAIRSADVDSLRADAAALCEEFRHDRVQMRRSLLRGLHQSSESVAGYIAAMRAELEEGRASLVKLNRRMARAQRAAMVQDRRERAEDVAELIGNFCASRAEMAQELSESLAQTMDNVRAHVSGLNEWGKASFHHIRNGEPVRSVSPDHQVAVKASAKARAPAATALPKAVKKKSPAAKAVHAAVRMPRKAKKK